MTFEGFPKLKKVGSVPSEKILVQFFLRRKSDVLLRVASYQMLEDGRILEHAVRPIFQHGAR